MPRKSFEQLMRAAGAAASTVRRGRLAKPAAAVSIIVSLDPTELGALELWIADQPDPKPTREEAARRLISEALIRKRSPSRRTARGGG
ncbi:hypothetical protein SAMN05444161_4693 [Rhizobiales bacterium GAS191]|nr:hypothetical protein SAMN05444161_4693 [Rhizobiales bacterium GAS191]